MEVLTLLETIEEMINMIDNDQSFEWLRSFEDTYKEICKR